MRGRTAALLAAVVILCGCSPDRAAAAPSPGNAAAPLELAYAEGFTVEYRPDGCVLAVIAGEDRFLIVPEGAEPDGVEPGVTVLRRPLAGLYLAASSAMDFFLRLDALEEVRMTSTAPEDWSFPAVRAAMEAGSLLYAGKYSAPDFERILAEGCPLAVESTMIFHSPAVREELEALGIPVLVERSSYEPHPLGRMEWMKLYGLLTGREAEAEAFFAEQVRRVQAAEDTGRTAVFFSVSPGGTVTVRRPGDYISRMIALAGGRSVPDGPTDSGAAAVSGMNLQMEAFYAAAKDADVLIYNGAVDGGVRTLAELLEKCPLLSEFRAVETGDAWCTERNLFQEPTAAGDVVAELRRVFDGTAEDAAVYLRRLR